MQAHQWWNGLWRLAISKWPDNYASMSPTELMSDVINRNGEILKMTLADFSQDEMLTRPVPGANHATWQIGHMIGSASHMFAAIAPGLVPDAAARIGEKCNGDRRHRRSRSLPRQDPAPRNLRPGPRRD